MAVAGEAEILRQGGQVAVAIEQVERAGEPQLQLAYQHLSLDDTSISGAAIQQNTDNGWIARAGVRIKGAYDAGPGTLQPYARVNFYKFSSGTDITRFIGPAGSTDIASQIGGAIAT